MAKYVLAKYLELFEENAYDFKYHFAPNGIIDWYGRTIRGATKMHNYLRHDVYPYFEHRNFLEPVFCDPIETKTTHLRTKICTNKLIDHVHSFNHLPDEVPMKMYGVSDADLTGALLQKIQPSTTTDNSYIENLTLPANAHKADVTRNLIVDHGMEQDSNMYRQQLKRSHDECNDNIEHLPKRGKYDFWHYGPCTLLGELPLSSDDDNCNLEVIYSPLQYIEVKGLLRTKYQSNAERNFEEREISIRLSFRRCLNRPNDNDIQFALIIYQPLQYVMGHISLKRNLLEQFIIAANANDDESDNDAAPMALTKWQPPSLLKRLNNLPSGPIPKRIAVQSLRSPISMEY